MPKHIGSRENTRVNTVLKTDFAVLLHPLEQTLIDLGLNNLEFVNAKSEKKCLLKMKMTLEWCCKAEFKFLRKAQQIAE